MTDKNCFVHLFPYVDSLGPLDGSLETIRCESELHRVYLKLLSLGGFQTKEVFGKSDHNRLRTLVAKGWADRKLQLENLGRFKVSLYTARPRAITAPFLRSTTEQIQAERESIQNKEFWAHVGVDPSTLTFRTQNEIRRLIRYQEMASTGTFVYFVEALGLNKVKVGCAKNLMSRITGLKSSVPSPLNVLFYETCMTEEFWHRELNDHRYLGEWFDKEGVVQVLDEKRPHWRDYSFYLEENRRIK